MLSNDGHFRAPYTLHRGDRCAIAETGAPGELRFQDRVTLKDGSGVHIRGHQNAQGQTVWIKPVQGGPNLRLAVGTDREGQARLLVFPRNGETEPTLSSIEVFARLRRWRNTF